MDLADLLERCRLRDETAWHAFHEWYGRLARRVLARYPTLTPVEREEAQDAARVRLAVQISDGKVRGTTGGEITNFAKVLLVNCARDVWKRKRPMEPLPPFLRDEGPSPWETARFSAQLDCARQLIDSWSADDRLIFLMKQENVSASLIKADVARLFGFFISEAAVDTRVYRLRNELRRHCFGDAARV
jgi:hypothetical protein